MDGHTDRATSVVDTSLTELAFILFFILLAVAAWQFREQAEDARKADTVREQLAAELADARSALAVVTERLGPVNTLDPEALVAELKRAEADRRALEMARETLTRLQSELSARQQMLQDYNDLRGQNLNLRQRLAQLDNGLDHPPCWADPETGAIQYVFNVIIREAEVEFRPGWPPSRDAQARANPAIMRVPGTYRTNPDIWARTRALFEASVARKCRHFVRIYDQAVSKRAFKNYLLGVENHFYKYLVPGEVSPP